MKKSDKRIPYCGVMLRNDTLTGPMYCWEHKPCPIHDKPLSKAMKIAGENKEGTLKDKLRDIINRHSMAIESTETGKYRKLKPEQYDYVVEEIMKMLAGVLGYL